MRKPFLKDAKTPSSRSEGGFHLESPTLADSLILRTVNYSQNPHPGPAWPSRLLLVPFFAFSFLSYLTFDYDHPPSHTDGGATQCECPGDDAPDLGSIPQIKVTAPEHPTFVDYFFLERPPLSSRETGEVREEPPPTVPRLLLEALPLPALLI